MKNPWRPLKRLFSPPVPMANPALSPPAGRTLPFLAAVLLALACLPLPLSASDHQTLHMKIINTTEASAPEIWKDYVIFTYRPQVSARSVSAAFEHEDFRNIHTYVKNEHGIYILYYPIPENIGTLTYRLIIDGLWMHDRTSRKTIRDDAGIRLSQVRIPQEESKIQHSPVIQGNRARFTFRGAPGKRIFVAGDFNNWDPFMHQMKEERPGSYALTLPIRPGRHYYLYIVDGRETTDPLNFSQAYNEDDKPLSTFMMP